MYVCLFFCTNDIGFIFNLFEDLGGNKFCVTVSSVIAVIFKVGFSFRLV